jgi:cytochrome c
MRRLLVFTLGLLLILGWPGRYSAAEDLNAEADPTPLTNLEPHYRASVLRGWQTFQTSFAADGVACVNCHPRLESLRHWPGAYPKVAVFDGTPYRVKSLQQVVMEALERHTDLTLAERVDRVKDLVAFLAWWGNGQVVTPGRSSTLPPATADLALLRAAAIRGEQLVQNRGAESCVSCHSLAPEEADKPHRSLRLAATYFPRYIPSAGQVMSLETFLVGHVRQPGSGDWSPDSETMMDLSAYLASLAAGSTYRPGHPRQQPQEQADE